MCNRIRAARTGGGQEYRDREVELVRSKPFKFRVACLASAACLLMAATLPSVAQDAKAAAPSWLMQDILPAAKAEGALQLLPEVRGPQFAWFWRSRHQLFKEYS